MKKYSKTEITTINMDFLYFLIICLSNEKKYNIIALLFYLINKFVFEMSNNRRLNLGSTNNYLDGYFNRPSSGYMRESSQKFE